MTTQRDMKRLEAEYELIRAGALRCSSKTTPLRCERVADHVGCHFAHLVNNQEDEAERANSGTCQWSDKGKKLGAAYPKRGPR